MYIVKIKTKTKDFYVSEFQNSEIYTNVTSDFKRACRYLVPEFAEMRVATLLKQSWLKEGDIYILRQGAE